jgi:beta-galactosidase
LLKCGINSDIVFPDADFSPYRVLILSACFCLSEQLSAKIDQFVRDGGTLVVLPLTGIADELSVMPRTAGPLGLTQTCGVKVVDRGRYNPIMGDLQFCSCNSEFLLKALPVRCYLDELIPDADTEILAEYSGNLYSGIPALTRHVRGRGQAYYMGTWFESDEDMAAFYDVLCSMIGLEREKWQLPESVHAVHRCKEDIDLTFVVNYTAYEQKVAAPDGEALVLKPFEVKLCKQTVK